MNERRDEIEAQKMGQKKCERDALESDASMWKDKLHKWLPRHSIGTNEIVHINLSALASNFHRYQRQQ